MTEQPVKRPSSLQRRTDQITAGALLRRHLRAGLDAAGIQYIEHKGWLDSIFVVTATEDQWQGIARWAADVNKGSQS